MEHCARISLSANQGLILEGNFDPLLAGPWVSALERQFQPHTVQAFFHADPDAILQRFKERLETGQRHPVHTDSAALTELEERLKKPLAPLEIKGTTTRFDTTDFNKFDLDAAVVQIAKAIGPVTDV